MRGGTSKGVFFHVDDLPADAPLRDRVILAAFGSPDPYRRQVDGLGGGTSTTSKVAMIGDGRPYGADVAYTFGQVSIDQALVDCAGNCGNLSAAVGPFALDEGLVAGSDPVTRVRFFNTNTGKTIVAHVPTRDGRYHPEGDFAIPGIPGTASRIQLDYIDPAGAVTGRLLPTGRPWDELRVTGLGSLPVSLVDAANPLVFVRWADVGMSGTEQPEEIDADADVLRRLEDVRATAAVLAGIASSPAEASANVPSVPKLAMVGSPRRYCTVDGDDVPPDAFSLRATMMSMGRAHRSYPLTGALCTAVAAGIAGSVVADTQRGRDEHTGEIVIGHPSGCLPMVATPRFVDGNWTVDKVSGERTARRLMEGHALVPDTAVVTAPSSTDIHLGGHGCRRRAGDGNRKGRPS